MVYFLSCVFIKTIPKITKAPAILTITGKSMPLFIYAIVTDEELTNRFC